MKAKAIKGLRRGDRLDDAAQRIIAVRLDECHRFMPAALDPDDVQTLHDLRIGAKRLRYVLEITAPLLGPYAVTARKRAKELQDLLGEIHDCDEMLPRVRALQATLRAAALADALRQAAAAQSTDLDPSIVAKAPPAAAWRGLETLALHYAARRAVLHGQFIEMWRRLERDGFRARLEYAITERSPQSREVAPATGSIEA